MHPVVRIGETVRREAGPWTPAVHRLLGALNDAGIAGVPRPLGLDGEGREILQYLPGQTLAQASTGEQWSETILLAAAALLRSIHDASNVLVDDVSLQWRSPRREPAEVICHNDFAPYNLIVNGGALVGAIDFDFASPGPRLWDLAYLAYRIVPFAEDAGEADALDRVRRLAQLIDAYGMPYEPGDVVSVAAARLDDLARFTRARARDTGRTDFLEHAAMYERDAARLRVLGGE